MSRKLTFDETIELVRRRGASKRSITAIAGPPAAGKSTVTARLAEELNRRQPGSAAILQMDGFHYDDCVLKDRGLERRKGSPQTFDVGGLACTLQRLRENVEGEIAVPIYDRSLELARAGAAIISQTAHHILVEGNYLLLKTPPWDGLVPLFDTTLFVSADIETLRARLTQRWRSANLPAEVVAAKVEENDLPNASVVISESRAAEFLLRKGRSGYLSRTASLGLPPLEDSDAT